MASYTVVKTREELEKYRVRIPDDVWPSTSTRASQPSPGQDGFFYIPAFVSEDEERYLIQKIQDAPQPKWKTLQNRRLQYWGGQVSSRGERSVLIPESFPDFMTKFPPLIERIAQTSAFAGSAHASPNHCLVNEYLPGQGILPHEDGSAYWPAVATVSVASHTLLDIYRWATEKPQGAVGADDDGSMQASQGDAAAARPARGKAREQEAAFSILQEPRSLLITTGAAYRDFLHGIAERTRDEAAHLAKVVNVADLRDVDLRAKVDGVIASSRDGDETSQDVLVRDTRYSLTFRDVEKVSKGLAGLLNKKR